MADDPVRIAQFWQAVEIFSPQSLPTIDPKNHTVDLQRRDRVPWDQHSHLPEAEPGYAWRHEPSTCSGSRRTSFRRVVLMRPSGVR